jgi:alkylresorcinol/alkylpyrone synthase/polyketide synthase Type III
MLTTASPQLCKFAGSGFPLIAASVVSNNDRDAVGGVEPHQEQPRAKVRPPLPEDRLDRSQPRPYAVAHRIAVTVAAIAVAGRRCRQAAAVAPRDWIARMSTPHVSVMPSPRPRLAAVGTAIPEARYEEEEIAELLGVPEGVGRRFFRTSGIETRHLYMRPTPDGAIPREGQSELLERHRRGGLDLGQRAIAACLAQVDLQTADIDFLCCVSSTGLMMPGMSAMYIRHLGFRPDCQRIDIVGMGCNAALNGLNAATGWTVANPGGRALLVCCEINSAIHVRDDRIVTALVNSLFGDGCGVLLITTDAGPGGGPEVLGLASHIIPDAWRAISFNWSIEHGKFELYLDKAIPTVLGIHSPTPISALLGKFKLCRCDVAHWLVHAGGKKVISAIGEANGLTPHDVRHATEVLRRRGNLGSPTVMFSYEDLLAEGIVAPGEYGVMVTMGPGATVETALIRW